MAQQLPRGPEDSLPVRNPYGATYQVRVPDDAISLPNARTFSGMQQPSDLVLSSDLGGASDRDWQALVHSTGFAPHGWGPESPNNAFLAEPPLELRRSIVVRLREVHLAQAAELKRLHAEATSAEAKQWDRRHLEACRHLDRENEAMAQLSKEDQVVSADIERNSVEKETLKYHIDSLNEELDEMETRFPGLKVRLAEEVGAGQIHDALMLTSQGEVEVEVAPTTKRVSHSRHIRLRPVRQAFGPPVRTDTQKQPVGSMALPRAKDYPFQVVQLVDVPRYIHGAEGVAASSSQVHPLRIQETAGVLDSVTDIEDARRGLNTIVQRLRSMDPLEAAAQTKPDSLGRIAANPAAALKKLRDNEDAVRQAQAESRQLRLELQAARGGERAARDDSERIRKELSEELRTARAQLHGGITREEVDVLQLKVQEQEQTIKTLTMQLAAIHSNWADDIEKMHQKYQLQLASARAKPASPAPARSSRQELELAKGGQKGRPSTQVQGFTTSV